MDPVRRFSRTLDEILFVRVCSLIRKDTGGGYLLCSESDKMAIRLYIDEFMGQCRNILSFWHTQKLLPIQRVRADGCNLQSALGRPSVFVKDSFIFHHKQIQRILA